MVYEFEITTEGLQALEEWHRRSGASAWDPGAKQAAYDKIPPVWRVQDGGTVPATYETHADNLRIVQS